MAAMIAILLLAAQIPGDPAQAVAALQNAIRSDPAKESNYTDLGNLLLSTQNFKEAAIVLEHTRAKFPKSAQAALSLGVAYYGQRRFEDAVSAYIDAAKLDADAEQPIAFLGRTIEHAGSRAPEVTALFAAYAKRQPKNYLGHYLSGKASGSAADLETAIRLNPKCGECYLDLGDIQERERDLDRAARNYATAAKLAPKNPIPHYRLSRVYGRLGQPEKAAAERAIHERLTAEEKAELDRRQAAARHLDLKVTP